MIRTFATVVAALCAALLSTADRAQAQPMPRIVVESHAGERLANSDELLEPVIEALTAARYRSPRDLGAALSKRSTSNRVLSADELNKAIAFIDSGSNQYSEGNYTAALTDARRGLAAIDAAPMTLIEKPSAAKQRQRALITIALANKRAGDAAGAADTMAELLRSFPEKPVDEDQFGPEPAELLAQVRSKAMAKTGSITVELRDESASVFINETYRGVGRYAAANLPAGIYRVVARSGDKATRVHRVEVKPGKRTTVLLSIELDSVLQVSDRWAGLVFDDVGRQFDSNLAMAGQLSRMVGATQFVLLSVTQHEGQRAVVGSVYDLGDTRPRRGAFLKVEPTPPSDDKLAGLGRYLGGDESAKVLVQTFDSSKLSGPSPKADRGGGGGGSPWKWVALAGGVSALAAGGVLIAIHKDEFDDMGNRAEDARNTRVAGFAVAGAGVVLTGLAIYLFVRGDGDSDTEQPPVALVPERGGGSVVWTLTF